MSVHVDLVTHSYRGYEYFFDDNPPVGNINGYVIIKPGQKGYDKKFDFTNTNLQCHGGISYDSKFDGPLINRNVPKQYRFIGFDTLHAGDYNPAMAKVRKQMRRQSPWMAENSPFRREHHWTKPEIGQECQLIIDGLIKGNYYVD